MLRSQALSKRYFSYSLLICVLFSELGKVFTFAGITLKDKVKPHLFLLFFLLPWHLQAADSSAFHVVNIPVVDQSKSVREQAFLHGLNKVFVRLSDDGAVMGELPQVDARRYVQRFSYQPLKNVVINSKGDILSQRIKIHYNGHLIDQYLRENGLVVQVDDSDQPRTIVHVAIEAVDSMTKYNRVENYLTQLRVVASVNAMQTEGEKAMFEVVLRGEEDVFLSLIKNDAKLLEVEVEQVEVKTNAGQIQEAKIQESKIQEAQTNTAIVKKSVQTIPEEVTSPAVPLSADTAVDATVDSVVQQKNKTPVYHFKLVD